ncbi:MAG: cytochrome c biogenesis protein CcdA [Rikenellaceae bacterium]
MKSKSLLLTLLCSVMFAISAMAQTTTWSVDAQHVEADEYNIVMTAKISQGWHIYDMREYKNGPNPTSITFSQTDGVEYLGAISASASPTTYYDELFGMEIGYYEGTVRFTQKIKLSVPAATIDILAESMMCNDGSCMPPSQEELSVTIGDSKLLADAAVSGSTPTKPEGKSMWGLIIEAIIWGFAALLTPCVFPMIPMTVSFFMKRNGSAARGRFMAFMYGVFIVAFYTLPIAAIILITRFAGGEAVTADIFNWLATHWLPNVIFFIVFMIFAASFFGAFEITLPSSIVNKSDENSDKGGLAGLMFMSLTLVLVSFSCTGPIVGSVLIKSTAGEFWEPIVTMLAFSVAFALPFVIFAFFPSMLKSLPKSGGWLNSVKVVLGFVEVALGLKFLSVADQTYHWGILDREVYLAIWIVVFTLMGFYLLGKLKFAHDSEMKHLSVPRLALAIATFSFVVYLIPGMFGAPLRGLSGYMPPLHTQDFILSAGSGAAAPATKDTSRKYSDFLHFPAGTNIDGFFDYQEAQEYANQIGKPLFVDFTGHGCVNCREMESKVWSDPEVLKLLEEEFVVVALYSDDKTVLPQENWVTTPNGKTLKSLGKINSDFMQKRYNAAAQPHYIVVDKDGNPLSQSSYNLNVEEYKKFLRRGIDQYHTAK